MKRRTAFAVLAFAAWPMPERASSLREDVRGQLLGEIEEAWRRPESLVRSTPEPMGSTFSPIVEKLNRIVLPELSFTNVDLGAVVRTLSNLSVDFDTAETGTKGVNLLLMDPGGKGASVSITLRNLSLKRVLDLIVDSVGYQYEVQSDSIVVRPGGATDPLATAYFPLSRSVVIRMTAGLVGSDPKSAAALQAAGESAALRTFLQQAGVGFSTVDGSGLAYDGAGVFATQTARNLERIRGILARYNEVRQVAIEAKFMEVQDGALDELGVSWSIARRGPPKLDPGTGLAVLDQNGRRVFTPEATFDSTGTERSLAQTFNGAQALNSILIDGSPAASTRPPRLPGSAPLGENAGPAATWTTSVADFDVNAVVRALAQKQGTDLLSAPRITVLSGHPATITVAQEMRYPQSYGQIQSQVGSTAGGASGGSGSAGVTITAGTPQDFTTRNVGVELKVTPNVEDDGTSISLDLNPKVTDFDGFMEFGGPSLAISAGTSVTVPPGFYQPIFSVREMSTRVTVWDGATLVMGGLTREEVKKVDDRVPVLGSIPLFGRLFRSKGESRQKRNLLIFVTASLVTPGGGPKNQSRTEPENRERQP